MKRKKERYRIISYQENVIGPEKPIYHNIKGRWRKDFFKNVNPIVLELACGRGEYTIGMASLFPNKNFIGIDIKGDRIWKGSTEATNQDMTNVAFLRIDILNLCDFFDADEVDDIWIIFPDPYPKRRNEKKRLTSPRFIESYKTILRKGGKVRLKTDNDFFYSYTLDKIIYRNDIEGIVFTENLYNSSIEEECFDIITKYEKIFIDRNCTIKYAHFGFNDAE